MLFFLLALAVVLFCIGGWVLLAQFTSVFSRAPYVPTSHARVTAMLDAAHIHEGTHVVDLGSGDGRIVAAAAKRGAYAIGYEMNLLLVIQSRFLLRLRGLQHRTHIYWGSYAGYDFRDQDVIFLYVLPSEMARLEKWLPVAIRPDTLVVSHAFRFPVWTTSGEYGSVHCYQIPHFQ